MNENRFQGLNDQLLAERNKVDVSSISFSVRELVRMYEDGELSIAPSYQRKYRWSPKVASVFVESIFLGLPVPPIFVATNSDFSWEVVDGLQRVSTLILFLSGKEEVRARVSQPDAMKLSDLEKITQLNGVTYEDLPADIQRHFARQPLQVISLTDKSDTAVRFDLFERLNTGSISLTPQEVRFAVYRGEFMEFVERMSQNPDLRELLKLQKLNQQDGTTAEQVLKFFAYKNDQENFSGGVTSFLNSYVEKASKSGFNYRQEETTFLKAVELLHSFTDGAFLRDKTSITPLVQFEACLVAIGRLIDNGKTPIQPTVDWLNDTLLVSASTGGTNTRAMLSRRINRAQELFTSGS